VLIATFDTDAFCIVIRAVMFKLACYYNTNVGFIRTCVRTPSISTT